MLFHQLGHSYSGGQFKGPLHGSRIQVVKNGNDGASCIDEVSGRKLLQDDRVPRDVRVRELHPVGNYGVSVLWSDDHDTGIYTYERLRELCPCDACRDKRPGPR